MLLLETAGWFRRAWRACAPGLLVLLVLLALLLLAACGSGPAGSTSAERPPASPTTTAPGSCRPDQAMGRPCPSGEDQSATTRQHAGEAGEEHKEGSYSELYEECEPFLERSFQAYKACLRY